MFWSWPFRPFFLAAALAGVLLVPAWLAAFLGPWQPPLALPLTAWHAHEMFFGLLGAALAGFLLTAVCRWTDTEPVSGIALASLVALWAAGRLAMAFGGPVPVPAALVDLAFLPLVALAAGVRILRGRRLRNAPVLVAVAGLWLGDLMFHLAAPPSFPFKGAAVAAGAAALLMLVVGGRITPAFTANWLRLRGADAGRVRTLPWLETLVLAGAASMALADLAGAGTAAALIAALTGTAALLRVVLWRGWLAADEPLLWILHLGMVWVAAALMLRAAGWWFVLAPTLWLHALGAGAMATLILGVMTRVSLGHTGRALKLPRGAVSIYWCVIASGAARVLTAAGWIDYRAGLWVSGALWTLAFALFLAWFAPVLLRPRADGRPG